MVFGQHGGDNHANQRALRRLLFLICGRCERGAGRPKHGAKGCSDLGHRHMHVMKVKVRLRQSLVVDLDVESTMFFRLDFAYHDAIASITAKQSSQLRLMRLADQVVAVVNLSARRRVVR